MRKYITIPLAAFVLLTVVAYSTATTFAQEEATGGQTLVQRIAERFGLNESEVQEVFDEDRADRHAQMLEDHMERLNKAVEDGLLTQDQKNTLLAMQQEHFSEMETLKGSNLSREEMHQKMQAHREEMQTWLESQGLDLGEIFGSFGEGFGGHRGKGFKFIN